MSKKSASKKRESKENSAKKSESKKAKKNSAVDSPIDSAPALHENRVSIIGCGNVGEKRGWIPHAFITFENNTNDRILLDPALWTLNVITPKPQVLTTKEPEKLASSLESRAKWAAAIGNAGAAFSTKQTTATVRAPDGSTSTATITEPDKDAQRSAAESGRRQQDASGSVADYVRTSSLKPNTVFPNTQVSGIVWYENKKYKEVVLTIVIGDIIYEFPFVKK